MKFPYALFEPVYYIIENIISYITHLLTMNSSKCTFKLKKEEEERFPPIHLVPLCAEMRDMDLRT